jgi:hypothetical protein
MKSQWRHSRKQVSIIFIYLEVLVAQVQAMVQDVKVKFRYTPEELDIKTRPRRPGFKGHPIEFMITLDPFFGPLF